MRWCVLGLLLSACLVVAPVDGDGDGYSRDDGDCDDVRADIYPGAAEVCDDLDNDCDGQIDDADPSLDWSTAATMYADADADGYGDAEQPARACFWADGYAENSDDCDDDDASVRPGADEVCGGWDEDCDGLIDDDDDSLVVPPSEAWYADSDGDGYGDPADVVTSCLQPPGYVADGSDCDDSDAYQSPASGEWIDGLDNDCDGLVDNNTVVFDDDGDCRCEQGDCLGSVNTGCGAVTEGDCDDSDAAISPDADEVCDGDDNDCDGTADEDDALDAATWYEDADGDGYGIDGAASVSRCEAPAGYGGGEGDCDDARPLVYPGAEERCDDTDSDCDGSIDDGDEVDAPTWYTDADRDGYGDDSSGVVSCESTAGGQVQVGGDCDDSDPSLTPEVAWYPDADGDGYGDADATPALCDPDASTDVADGTDCDDSDADTYPDAEEVRADGLDQDCDGLDVTWVKVSISDDDAACALDSLGGIACWGDDNSGEVDDAPTENGYLDVALGHDHACAIAASGFVECWGSDTYNQAWPPTTLRFTALAAGYRSTCGIRTDTSRAFCWGNDDYDIVSGEPSYAFSAIDGMYYAYCGLDVSGRLRCWGDGDGVSEASTDTGFSSFTTNRYTGCALDSSGSISCWGQSSVTSDVPDGSKYGPFVDVAASVSGACAIDSSGRLYCWGHSSLIPEPSGTFSAIFMDHGYGPVACAIDTSGGMTCWGYGIDVVTDAP